MAMKRRVVLKIALGGVAVCTAPLLRVLEHVAPLRVERTLKGRIYPGPRKQLDPSRIDKPGKWKG